jgi:hypothetical protein
MIRQDGHLQFDPTWTNLRSYAHGQLRLEQGKVAINCLGGSLQEWMENKSPVNFHGFGSGDAGGPIDSRVGDPCNHVDDFTDVAAPSGCWRLFEENKSVARFAVERGGGA